MSIQQGYYNRIRYTLYHHLLGSQIIEEPEGWRDDEKELARNSKYHGIFARFSNSAKYYGNGYDFLKTVYEIDGINANVRLSKDIKHPKTDDWVREYEGVFDFSTYQEENKKISLKFNSDGIEEVLKARESEEIEIERETDLDGNILPALNTKSIWLEGRKIFLQSEWGNSPIPENKNTILYNSIWQSLDSTRAVSVPFGIDISSHEEAQSILDVESRTVMHGSTIINSTQVGQLFFIDSQKDRTLKIKGNVAFDFKTLVSLGVGNGFDYSPLTANLDIVLVKYKYDNGNIVGREVLQTIKHIANIPKYFTIVTNVNESFEYDISIETGDCLTIEVSTNATFIGEPPFASDYRIYIENFDTNLTMEEDSYFDPSYTKVVLAHELAERLLNIITGKQKTLYSEALGRKEIGYATDGVNTGAFTGLAHGMWIRQFDILPIEDNNKYKPFKTSFKDLQESFYATYGLGLGIEKIGNKERVRIEHLSYFYNRNTTIKLPMQVKNVKRSISKDHFFSALEIGYEKGGTYDEAQGLDEYNTKSNYISCITRVKNVLSLVSKYRSDMYGAEFARRKPKVRKPNEDTSYDQDVFMFDVKRVNNNLYNQRKWQDDFEAEPTGVYDPESATNLRLSPANCLMRNSWYFHSGLIKYPEQFLRFGSSTGNSNLKTKQPDKPELSENEDIQNNQLDRPRFVPEIIEFEHNVDFEINEQLKGKSMILGKEIMNIYGCIEFTNENGEQEKGFLINLKPNKKGQWKLLKAY